MCLACWQPEVVSCFKIKTKKSHNVFFVILYFILFKMFCTLKNIILICRNLEKKYKRVTKHEVLICFKLKKKLHYVLFFTLYFLFFKFYLITCSQPTFASQGFAIFSDPLRSFPLHYDLLHSSTTLVIFLKIRYSAQKS